MFIRFLDLYFEHATTSEKLGLVVVAVYWFLIGPLAPTGLAWITIKDVVVWFMALPLMLGCFILTTWNIGLLQVLWKFASSRQ